MGFRFRKAIRIAPGLTVNLGKSGFTSVRLGNRRGGVTMGKRGVTGSVSLGGGLSYQTKLLDSGSRTQPRQAAARPRRAVAVTRAQVGPEGVVPRTRTNVRLFRRLSIAFVLVGLLLIVGAGAWGLGTLFLAAGGVMGLAWKRPA
jgi:hypothetical protein